MLSASLPGASLAVTIRDDIFNGSDAGSESVADTGGQDAVADETGSVAVAGGQDAVADEAGSNVGPDAESVADSVAVADDAVSVQYDDAVSVQYDDAVSVQYDDDESRDDDNLPPTFVGTLAQNGIFDDIVITPNGTTIHYFGVLTYDQLNGLFIGWEPRERQVLAMCALALLSYQVQLAHGNEGFVSPLYLLEQMYNIVIADDRSGRIAASVDQGVFYRLLRFCAIAFFVKLTPAIRVSLLNLAAEEPYNVVASLTNDESGLCVRILQTLMTRQGARTADEVRLTLCFRGIITFRVCYCYCSLLPINKTDFIYRRSGEYWT